MVKFEACVVINRPVEEAFSFHRLPRERSTTDVGGGAAFPDVDRPPARQLLAESSAVASAALASALISSAAALSTAFWTM